MNNVSQKSSLYACPTSANPIVAGVTILTILTIAAFSRSHVLMFSCSHVLKLSSLRAVVRSATNRGAGEEDSDDLPPHMQPYVNGIVQGELCTFIIGFAPFVLETQVAVESVAHFMPGMRIAIAAHYEDVPLFERCGRRALLAGNGDWEEGKGGGGGSG